MFCKKKHCWHEKITRFSHLERFSSDRLSLAFRLSRFDGCSANMFVFVFFSLPRSARSFSCVKRGTTLLKPHFWPQLLANRHDVRALIHLEPPSPTLRMFTDSRTISVTVWVKLLHRLYRSVLRAPLTLQAGAPKCQPCTDWQAAAEMRRWTFQNILLGHDPEGLPPHRLWWVYRIIRPWRVRNESEALLTRRYSDSL